VILAQELDAEIDGLTNGQADGGVNGGTYLELGVSPGYALPRATIAVPIKAGFSLGDYYELSGADNSFGFFSVAGTVTVPLGGTTGFGAWNVHGGIEFQALGDTTQAFNGGESTRTIGSIGIGFTY
jgi:hypothetical protein